MDNNDALEARIERYNQALFEMDPMHTCCVENELYDEYIRIAEGIAALEAKGKTLEEAVATEFELWFDEPSDSPKVAAVAERLAMSESN